MKTWSETAWLLISKATHLLPVLESLPPRRAVRESVNQSLHTLHHLVLYVHPFQHLVLNVPARRVLRLGTPLLSRRTVTSPLNLLKSHLPNQRTSPLHLLKSHLPNRLRGSLAWFVLQSANLCHHLPTIRRSSRLVPIASTPLSCVNGCLPA